MPFGIKLIDGISQTGGDFKMVAGEDVDITETTELLTGDLVDADSILVDAGHAGTQASTKHTLLGSLWAYIRGKFSGDISVAADGVTTISDDAVITNKILASNVTLDKIADIADDSILGNVSGAAAAPAALDAAAIKTMLTISSVDDTADANKPVSGPTVSALNLKANIASPAFTGTAEFANVITNSTAANPVIDITGSALSPVKGIGIFTNDSARDGLSATKRGTGYLAIDSTTGVGKVYTGSTWTTGTDWKDLLQIGELPVASVTNSYGTFDSASELLLYGNVLSQADFTAKTPAGAHMMAYTTGGGLTQQFKFTFDDLIGAMVGGLVNISVQGGYGSVDAYEGDSSGLVGDFNDDGIVNTEDLLTFLGQFGETAPEASPTTVALNVWNLNETNSTGFMDLSSTSDPAYTAGDKVYFTIGQNGVPAGTTYYIVTEGSPAVVVDYTNDYIDFLDASSGNYDLQNRYGSASSVMLSLTLTNLILNNEGLTEDTVTIGMDVDVIGDNDAIIHGTSVDCYHHTFSGSETYSTFSLDCSASASNQQWAEAVTALAVGLKAEYPAYQAFQGLPIPQGTTNDTSVLANNSSGFYNTHASGGGFTAAQLPIKGYRVKAWARSSGGASTISASNTGSAWKIVYNPMGTTY